MKNVLIIACRELRSFFNSPVAYIVLTVYLLLAGYLYFTQLFLGREAEMRGLFELTPLLFVFFVPAVTMRLIAEERRAGTLEVLLTLPLTDWQVVLGKFLGALGLLAVGIGLTLAYPFTVSKLGDLDGGAVLGGYLGLLFLGATYAAIGVMASSFAKNQVVAFIIALGICFALFLAGKLVGVMPRAIAPIVDYLSLDSHFQSIARGVIDTRDLVYYASISGACLFVAQQSLASRQWKG
ncbi:MAG: ABC transporter permease subunit [Myxococcota bacterium]